MPSTDIKIDGDQFAQIIAEHIMERMETATRDKLVKDAIVALNKVPSGYGASKETPIQQAFNVAVQGTIVEVVKRLVAESEIQHEIETAARGFIRLFPEAWKSQVLQQKIMGVVIEHIREAEERSDFE